MVNYEEPVLNVVSPAGALLIVEEVDHLSRIPKHALNVASHRLGDDGALDVEIQIAIDPDVVRLVAWVGIRLNIVVHIEKVLVAL